MDVIFNCSNCNQELEVDEAAVGQEIDCPSCDQKLVIPPPDPNRKPRPQTAPDGAAPDPDQTGPAETTPSADPPKPAQEAGGHKHRSVPLHDKPEILVRKTDSKAASPQERQLRVRTIRHYQCMEVGHDRFDEKVTDFIHKVGEDNIQSITPVSCGFYDTTGHVMPDYGVLIIYKG